MPVACALIPRFRLIAALADQGNAGTRCGVGPRAGAAQLIGEVSEPAEGFGLRPGMRLGEALSRCPELALIPPDRSGPSARGRRLRRLEESARRSSPIAPARPSSKRVGWSPCGEGSPASSPGPGRSCARVLRAVRGATRLMLAAGPPGASALRRGAARPGRSGSPSKELPAPFPVSLLCGDWGTPTTFPTSSSGSGSPPWDGSPASPRRGLRPLRAAGALAQRLARGEDEPLRPRPVREAIAVELELPEAVSGQQLERALSCDLAAARPSLPAREDPAGASPPPGSPPGRWRRQVALRRASAEANRLDALLPTSPCSRPRPRRCGWKRWRSARRAASS
jgi:protein ImuB